MTSIDSEYTINENKGEVYKPDKIQFSKLEYAFSIIILILSFIFVKFAVFNTAGFITTGVFAFIITSAIAFLKKNGCKFSGYSKFSAAVLYFFSTVYSITDNRLIKILNTVFMVVAGAYFVYASALGAKKIERFLPFVIMKSVFEYPFSQFGREIHAVRDTTMNLRISGKIKTVITAIIVTIPLTCFVAALLMSADDGVRNILKDALNLIDPENIAVLVVQLALAFLCACYLFGMLYSNIHIDKSRMLDEKKCDEFITSVRKVKNTAVCASITPICILYVIFFVSQTNYFLYAFSGKLPTGYNYSKYARQGFFELCIITAINLLVIAIVNVIAEREGGNKQFSLKMYNIVLCVFTLFMIAVAISKMFMYISKFGLTRLRIYTSWFMALCAFIFILIIIKQFKLDFRLSKWSTVIFTVMFGILCFSRPDFVVAKYNIAMYESGELEELDIYQLTGMSDDSWEVLLESDCFNVENRKDFEGIAELKKRELKDDSYERLNISSLKVLSFLD